MEPLPIEHLRASGWIARILDGAWSPEIAEKFEELVGPGEYLILGARTGPNWISGEILLSPLGHARLTRPFRRSEASGVLAQAS